MDKEVSWGEVVVFSRKLDSGGGRGPMRFGKNLVLGLHRLYARSRVRGWAEVDKKLWDKVGRVALSVFAKNQHLQYFA